jgi:hypothetical protein
MFDHFWDFNKLVEDRELGEADIAGYRPLFRALMGLGFM